MDDWLLISVGIVIGVSILSIFSSSAAKSPAPVDEQGEEKEEAQPSVKPTATAKNMPKFSPKKSKPLFGWNSLWTDHNNPFG
jgi:hypothetical protein